MPGEIRAYDRLGNKITVSKEEVGQLYALGGRVATRADQDAHDAEARQTERAEKAGIGGTVQTVVGAVGGALNPLMYTGGPGSTGEAYNRGVTHGATAGLNEVAERKVIDATAGPGAGAKYAQQLDDVKTTSPYAHGAGEMMGLVGGTALGASTPAGAIGRIGGLAEGGANALTKGVAVRGALGKAAATGIGMGVRGATEGAIYSGVTSATDDLVHDHEVNGEKLYTAIGHGALAGGTIGGGLGFGGSLAVSGARAARRSIVGSLSRGASDPIPVAQPVPYIDADAGLRGGFEAEQAFAFGPERQPIGIRPMGGARRAASGEAPISMSRGLNIDPDAGLHAPKPRADETPIFSMFSQGTTRDARRAAVESGLLEGAEKAHETRLAADLFKPGKVKAGPGPVRSQFEIGIDPDAGIAARESSGKFQGKVPAEDALRFGKSLPRDVSMGDVGANIIETGAGPIRLPEIPQTPDQARVWAAEQAWKAVGAGFGLQTTRYAKEATKYFPNGTTDLGEIALRHGAFDIPPDATPLQASIAAARSGTPDIIAPKLAAATESVGARIGEITEASGARVSISEVQGAIRKARSWYASHAGYEHVVSALDNYEASLVQKLGGGRDTSVQALLEQRKGLDRLVYEEAKTLDPKGRVAALREVRTHLENAITDALDGASGRVSGELRAEYKALKRDYHGLRILTEAAEDSAARATKGATFGFGEKFAVASSVASGHFAAAPVLALGGKMIRERGNAAAAAFLSRAAERGSFAKLLGQANEMRTAAVKGVLSEAPAAAAGKAPKRTAHTVEASQAETVALRSQADAIMQWQGQVRANPKRMMDALAEAAEVVGRTAGPRTASAYTSATLRAFNYISRYVPVKDRRDPLDPRSVPPLTYDEADRLVRAHKYATEPGAVWKDFGRGVITPEGLDWANEVPEQFAEFRTELLAHVTEHMLKHKQLSQGQRLRIDKLLGTPAGPDLRPDAIARHQADFLEKVPDDASGPQPPQAGGQPVNMKISQAGFDAVEQRKAL